MAILKGQIRREKVKEGTSSKNGKEYYIREIMFLEDGGDEVIPVGVKRDFVFEQGKRCVMEVQLLREGFGIKAEFVKFLE